MVLARARLKKRCTDDRLIQCEDDVPIGWIYQVDLETRQTVRLWNTEHGVMHEKEIISVMDADGGWIPTEMLDIEPAG